AQARRPERPAPSPPLRPSSSGYCPSRPPLSSWLPAVAQLEEHAAAAVEEARVLVVEEAAEGAAGIQRGPRIHLVRIDDLGGDVARVAVDRMLVQRRILVHPAALDGDAQALARIDLPAEAGVEHRRRERRAAVAQQVLAEQVELDVVAKA